MATCSLACRSCINKPTPSITFATHQLMYRAQFTVCTAGNFHEFQGFVSIHKNIFSTIIWGRGIFGGTSEQSMKVFSAKNFHQEFILYSGNFVRENLHELVEHKILLEISSRSKQESKQTSTPTASTLQPYSRVWYSPSS